MYEESTRNIYEELSDIYGLFGTRDRVGLFASHLPHGLNFFNRREVYAWFNKWLDNPAAGSDEADLDIFPENQLNVTTTGQVLTSLGGRSVVQLNSDRTRAALQNSKFRGRSLASTTLRRQANDRLTNLLALPAQRTPLHSRIRSSNPRKGAIIEEFQFESEPGIRIPGWFVKPSSSNTHRPTILYLTESGGNDIVAEPGSMDSLLAADYAVCAINLRGLDITLPGLPSGGPDYYGGEVHIDERFAWTCLVMGKPVIGQRVWDAMRAIDYLVSRPDVDAAQIRVLGVGSAGLVALMTTFLDRRPRSVLVNGTLVSYLSIIESENYSVKHDWFAPGILREFDLPQIAAGLSPRPCWIVNGVDPNGSVLSENSVREQIRGTNNQVQAPASLRILIDPERDPQSIYSEWLKQT